MFDYPGRYKDEQHGKDFTLYRMEMRSDAEKGHRAGNSPTVAGTRFTLTEHPQKMLNVNSGGTEHSVRRPAAGASRQPGGEPRWAIS
ncbi:MAG: hypothetical protein ACLRP3_00840 [Escherichia sp.]